MEWRTTISEFLDYLQAERNASANTVMAYRNDLAQFAEYLSTTQPHDATWASIDSAVISAYVEVLNQHNYTASTKARKIAALKTLFNRLHALGLIADVPTRQLRSPKVDKRVPRLLTEEEVAQLFEAAARTPPPRGARDRALLEVIYSTGMRVSEAINLRLADVDFELATVRCAGRGTRQPRSAPLTPSALTALREYLDRARGEMVGSATTEYVFVNPLGVKLTRQAVWQLTRQFAQAANIQGELTPHTLRHSRAAHMLNGGEDIKRVQEWLGHANLATTQMYRSKPPKESMETTLVVVNS